MSTVHCTSAVREVEVIRVDQCGRSYDLYYDMRLLIIYYLIIYLYISTCARLMSLISSLHRPNKILEIGTFTGYSALCLAEGLIPLSKSTSANNMQSDRRSDDMTSMIRKNVIEVLSQYHQSTDKRGLLVSVDKDLTSMKIAEKYILQSPLKDKVRQGEGTSTRKNVNILI